MSTNTLELNHKKDTMETPKHVCIIKYLNYQRIKVNNNLLGEIKNVAENQGCISNLENAQITPIQLSQIKKLTNILSEVETLKKEGNLYMYYIFILLNLTPTMIKNLTRLLIAKVYLNHQVKCLYNYSQIMQRNNYLDDLISILHNLHCLNVEYLDIFIETIHLFFT